MMSIGTTGRGGVQTCSMRGVLLHLAKLVEDGDNGELCVVEGCGMERCCEDVHNNGEEGGKLRLTLRRHSWDGMIGDRWRWKMGNI